MDSRTTSVPNNVVGIALECLRKERKARRHRKRLSKMVTRRAEKLEQRKLDLNPNLCRDCLINDHIWTTICCGFNFYSLCVVNGYLDSHVHIYRRKGGHLDFCGKLGNLILTMAPEYDSMNAEFFSQVRRERMGHI